MQIAVEELDHVTVARIEGEIDGATAPAAQERILPLAQPGAKILLDLTGVGYMSSAGLRMLLSTYRQVARQNGRIALVGVADEIRETMEVTGFLTFFLLCPTVEEGVRALEEARALNR